MSVFLSEPLQTILVLIAGFFTGVLSGMFGVGGAVVSTPAIRALGATPVEAIGSTLPSLPTISVVKIEGNSSPASARRVWASAKASAAGVASLL